MDKIKPRRSKYDDLSPEQIAKVEEAYLMDCTHPEAAIYSNVYLNTLLSYINRHPEFAERVKTLQSNPFLVARKTMMRGLAQDHDFALRYMERKAKSGFSLKQEIEHSGGITQKTVVIDAGPNPYKK